MAPDDWACAQSLLRAASAEELAAIPAAGTCLRLKNTLQGLRTGDAGWRDLAALVRQILLETEAARGVQPSLVVPTAEGMPTSDQWSELRCVAVPSHNGFSVSAAIWHPPIGPDERPEFARADLRQVYQKARPGTREHRQADPFWITALGHEFYVSPGQRQAARAVALAPPGSTTIISLPTGQGKTDVVLASIIMASAASRTVSVVVVPTVVLALDMERRTRRLVEEARIKLPPSGRFAYTGSLSEDTKQEIRRGIREGTQKLVFTSPEALVTGLSVAVMDAAVNGYLRYLVIDEAHLVEQWGSEFRPEFQAMAAHRMAWINKAPHGKQPITIAMSATLTERQIRTICDLFGAGQEDTALIWASALRKEPSYYVHRLPTEEERTEEVLRAVSLLPRPLALYTTLVDDAHKWVRLLRQAGIRRVAEVTGNSSEEQRQAVVAGWRNDDTAGSQYDIVVGTSAFGLGVDLPDVRSVVHACLPETIDRYYQEVGRGGRAGHASIAHLVLAPKDFELAERMNTQTIIGVDKGWDRWQHMYRNAQIRPDGTATIDVDLYPPHLMESSKQGRQWNVRTLNLMKLAKLITIQAVEPPQREKHEPDADWELRMERFLSSAAARLDVSIVDGGTNDFAKWSSAITAQRGDIIAAQKQALADMHGVLSPVRCVGETLAQAYRTRWNGGRLGTVVNCRGCPHCRKAQNTPRRGLMRGGYDPNPAIPSWPARPDPLARLRGNSGGLRIQWNGDQERRDLLPELLANLVRRGMPVVAGPGADRELLRQVQEDVYPTPLILDDDEDLITYSDLPVVWVAKDFGAISSVISHRVGSGEITYVLRPAPSHKEVPFEDHRLWSGRAAVSVRVALGEF
ncbi:protein DpdF [Thermopolyspora sp. NPDC052614]|uniref:protein DpdF n=1 Tax=Thermopolyspora sp. NPDC052614 TaxID=3155682 RepID=UPI00342CE68D